MFENIIITLFSIASYSLITQRQELMKVHNVFPQKHQKKFEKQTQTRKLTNILTALIPTLPDQSCQ